MSILDTLKRVKEEGFNPATDSINGNGGLLPAGRYPVALQSAQHGASKMGQEQVSIGLEVVSGEDKGRRELIFISFDAGVPEFVLDKNAKIIISILHQVGIGFTEKDLEDYESLASTLQRGIGKQFLMNLTVTENKKNPKYPYRNYEFEALETIDLDESPLPFL